MKNRRKKNPNLPTGRFFAHPGAQETIYYLRVAFGYVHHISLLWHTIYQFEVFRVKYMYYQYVHDLTGLQYKCSTQQ